MAAFTILPLANLGGIPILCDRMKPLRAYTEPQPQATEEHVVPLMKYRFVLRERMVELTMLYSDLHKEYADDTFLGEIGVTLELRDELLALGGIAHIRSIANAMRNRTLTLVDADVRQKLSLDAKGFLARLQRIVTA